MGIPDPHTTGRMGTRIPILPVVWGSGIPNLGDPHSTLTPGCRPAQLSSLVPNIYRSDAESFAARESILLQEGTTQRDPLAMAMYALGTLPLLIRAVTTPGASQTRYADDAAAGGNLRHIQQWWDQLAAVGPDFGYFANT